MQVRVHRCGQVIEHVTLLQLERGDSCQHPLDVAAAFGAVRAGAALAHADGGTQRTLGPVVGGLHLSLPRKPTKSSPSNCRAALPLRSRWMANTTTSAVAATHNHAFFSFSRQPVSSAFTLAASRTYSRASSTGARSAALMLRSSLQMLPRATSTPSTLSTNSCTSRFVSRSRPVSNATTAVSLGPKAPLGTPGCYRAGLLMEM